MTNRGWCFYCALALAEAVRAQTAAPASQPARQPIETWVAQLEHYRYSVRDDATRSLCELTPAELPKLISFYRAEHRYEPKLRLRYAIEQVYYRQLMVGESAFLGIRPAVITSVYDPATRQTVNCIAAAVVTPGNPASRGGMRDKDVILEFDHQPVERFMDPAGIPKTKKEEQAARAWGWSSPEIEAFTSNVKRRQPGAQIAVRLLRETGVREVRVTGGVVEAQTVVGTTVLAGGGPLDVPRGALQVVRVPEKSWMAKAGLTTNDVVAFVDNQPATAELLDRALQAARPDRGVKLVVQRFEQVNLTLRLGVRPPEMMNQPDWGAAQNRFAVWWRDAVGEPSVRLRPPEQQNYFAITVPLQPASESKIVP